MAAGNDGIVAAFRELAALTVLDEGGPQSFRARAYENALAAIERAREDLAALSDRELAAIDGIGASTAKKIRELVETGRIGKLEALRRKYPPSVVELTRVPGLGPKKIGLLRRELGVESLDDLRRALQGQRLRELPGMGAKTEEALARALARVDAAGKQNRTPIGVALPLAERLAGALEGVEGVRHAMPCGSVRRFRDTIGDLDLLVAADAVDPVLGAVGALPEIEEVLAGRGTKGRVRTTAGIEADVRVVAPAQLGAAALYFTGSKAHNIALRQRAIARGWTLSEYALAAGDGGRVIASESEEAIYAALDLAWIPPTLREGAGEIEAAAADQLPDLVEVEDLRGDLHVHTDRSGDARDPLPAMVAAAAARGLSYLAITDHAEDLVLNGVSRDELLRQRDEIEALRPAHPGLRILHGVELNIGPEGGLDYDDAFRRSFDWVLAGVHSHFDLDRTRQTDRLLRAIEDPSVHCIAHLTGRMLGKRPGIELDLDAVLDALARTGTALEINASPARLDASAEVLWQARGRDVALVLSTDAHACQGLDKTRWGVPHAQRGWVERRQVRNAAPADAFVAWTRDVRRRKGA